MKSSSVLEVLDIDEMNGYVIIVNNSPAANEGNINLIDPLKVEVVKEYFYGVTQIYGVCQVILSGDEYIYFAGGKGGNFYIFRTSMADISLIDDIVSVTISWINITTDYYIEDYVTPTTL